MKGKWLFGIFGLLFISLVCLSCTSVSGNVESAFSFSTPTPINNLLIGSFIYDINEDYVKLPNGTLISASNVNQTDNPELYEGSGSYSTVLGKQTERLILKKNIIASYDELYLWAIRCAAEKAGITNIIAIKSFLTTTITTTIGSKARQDVTITVYGNR